MGRTCPHCKVGQLFLEDGEVVCLQCGWRGDAMAEPRRDGAMEPRRDGDTPADGFAALVAAVEKTAELLRRQLEETRERGDVLEEQINRVHRALVVLTAPKPSGRKRGHWSPAQRAAHSERMKEARRRQREAVAA